ncbi:uncharacterized protein LOC111717205 isoform X6 [Eurytemora carolleeae]|uniref:uncharacterized protein LOC111717205 isoform X6 n=1 Tax=Eurytemora carolleeae TaxID=1294199 RepID=UPI000C792984|nr:uncharacterized protein LOC111717205 isoform X6 [Eurytemora carolleeae]|eukprot:XP_023348488.1 uncharacterized protein LOC111717205 isoform X6 [Eurytemora affinis]
MSNLVEQLPIQEIVPDLQLSVCKKLTFQLCTTEILGNQTHLEVYLYTDQKDRTCMEQENFLNKSLKLTFDKNFLSETENLVNIFDIIERIDVRSENSSDWMTKFGNFSDKPINFRRSSIVCS